MGHQSALLALVFALACAIAIGCGEAEVADPELATRRVTPNCDPGQAGLAYKDLEGKPAYAKLAWTDMPKSIANLEIPIQVEAISPRGPMISVDESPIAEKYLALWRESGHMLPIGKYQILDPCSATLSPRN